jgi:ATP-dependent Zn protease
VGDIQGATALVWEGITAFGVDEVFGPVGLKAAQSAVAQNNQGGSFLTDMAPTGWLQDLAQQRLHTWMTWGLSEARRLLNAHWDQVDRLALALFERKTMSNAEVRSVLGASGSDFKLLEIPGQPPANNAPQRNRII